MDVSEIKASDPSSVTVELRPHTGVQRTAVGEVKVTLPQKVVFINGVWSGYVGDAPGSHISLIHSGLPQNIVDEVKRKVDALRGVASTSIAQVKNLEQNDVRLEAVEDEDESLADEGI